MGWAYSEIYNLEKAFHCNNRALDNVPTLRKSPAYIYSASEAHAQTEVNLIENKFEMGKIDEAWEHINRFEVESSHPDYVLLPDRWLTRLKDLKGTILLGRGELDGAEELAEECLGISKKRGFLKYIARAERLFGKILTVRGRYDQAAIKLQSALTKLEDVRNPKQLWITHTALAQLYEKMKRFDLEREQWHAAASIVESTAEELQEEELREAFINAAPVREITERANR
jgi:tetratricopeptide (TPR) repeat protein